MFTTDHLDRLLNVGYFKAPSHPSNLGVIIPPLHETLEILIGGNVYFEINGEDRLFGAGAIFWHLPGEMTLRKNVIENPYECLVVNFKLKKFLPRQVPKFPL